MVPGDEMLDIGPWTRSEYFYYIPMCLGDQVEYSTLTNHMRHLVTLPDDETE